MVLSSWGAAAGPWQRLGEDQQCIIVSSIVFLKGPDSVIEGLGLISVAQVRCPFLRSTTLLLMWTKTDLSRLPLDSIPRDPGSRACACTSESQTADGGCNPSGHCDNHVRPVFSNRVPPPGPAGPGTTALRDPYSVAAAPTQFLTCREKQRQSPSRMPGPSQLYSSQ